MSDLEYQLGECEALIETMKALQSNKGFMYLKSVFKQQEILRRNAVLLDNFEGLDGLIKRDQLVSELRGINTVLSMPEYIIKEAELSIEGIRNQMSEEDENG